MRLLSLLLCWAAVATGFRLQCRPTQQAALSSLRLHSSKSSPEQAEVEVNSVQKQLKRSFLPILLGASMFASPLQSPPQAIAAGATSTLETSIRSLEEAGNRKEAIQAMADVFEAAESKTLLVRTKYKYRIITAINQKHVLLSNEWDQPLSYESNELKRRVDPYRTVDLRSYLQIAPFIGGVVYILSLFVQQSLTELFIFAYPAAVFVVVAPILFIVLTT